MVQPAPKDMMIQDPRAAVPFRWSASCGIAAYATLAGVRFDRLFHDIDAVADGASSVFTIVWREMCTPETAEKVRAFIYASRPAEEFLASGGQRQELRESIGAG